MGKNEAGIHSPDGQKEKKKISRYPKAPMGKERLNAGIRGPDGPRNTFSCKKAGIHGPGGLRKKKKGAGILSPDGQV